MNELKKKFILRRGFKINKNSNVLIVEDVITTGKSSMECVNLIKKAKAKLVGFACIIDRSNKKNLKIKNKPLISQLKIQADTFHKKNLPLYLKKIPVTSPGSRRV